MEESQHLKKIYGMFEMMIYLYIFLDVYINTLSLNYNNNTIRCKNKFQTLATAYIYEM